MSNRYLSQEEIDAILKFGAQPEETKEAETLSSIETDALGEVANISMGTAATTLSQLLNQRVSITTPRVKILSKRELFEQFTVPYVAIMVKYVEGLSGFNLLVMKTTDASIIADILMGGPGNSKDGPLDEIQISAVSEVMNQMIGTSATSMHTMFNRKVNISPPQVVLFDMPPESSIYPEIAEDNLVIVFFRMVIGDLIDSEILQVMPIKLAREQVEILMGGSSFEEPAPAPQKQAAPAPPPPPPPQPQPQPQPQSQPQAPAPPPPAPEPAYQPPPPPPPPPPQPAPEVHRAEFSPLPPTTPQSGSGNIDLILDVSLQVSVVLGKSRKTIKEILALGNGSVVELDRMVEDTVDVLVNGTLIARGEIVVVNENFGVRLTSILSPQERIKEIGRSR